MGQSRYLQDAVEPDEIVFTVTSDEFQCNGNNTDRRRWKRRIPYNMNGQHMHRTRNTGCQSFYRCNNDKSPVYVVCAGHQVFNPETRHCDRWAKDNFTYS
jgi:hypothetical protein